MEVFYYLLHNSHQVRNWHMRFLTREGTDGWGTDKGRDDPPQTEP